MGLQRALVEFHAHPHPPPRPAGDPRQGQQPHTWDHLTGQRREARAPQSLRECPAVGPIPAPWVPPALRGHCSVKSPPHTVREPRLPSAHGCEGWLKGGSLYFLITDEGGRKGGFLEPPKQAGVKHTTTKLNRLQGGPVASGGTNSTLLSTPPALGPGVSFHRMGRWGRTWT